jgi:peroxiredoxin
MKGRAGACKWKEVYHVLLWSIAAGVLSLNFVLLIQNKSLRAALLNAGTEVPIGRRLRGLAGATLDGRWRVLELPSGGSRILIITFSPGCPGCQANQLAWAGLAPRATAAGWTVVWVSRDPVDITHDYCMKEHIAPSAVLADPPYSTYVQLALKRVPNTIMAAPDGTVERVWSGVLTPARFSEISSYFLGSPEPNRAVFPKGRKQPESLVGSCGPGEAEGAMEGCK